jgi:hypothetical protein
MTEKITEETQGWYILANLRKRQFVDPSRLKAYPNSEGGETKVLHVWRGDMSGVLPFLIANKPPRYPTMGIWEGDSVEIIGSESSHLLELHEGISQGWKDITEEVNRDYAAFMAEDVEDAGVPTKT